MTADDLRRYLAETHGSEAIPVTALEAYAAEVSGFEATIRAAADARLAPESEPADFAAALARHAPEVPDAG